VALGLKPPVRLGVAGATGAVGLEMLKVLEERAFPIELIRLMASGRAESRSVRFGGDDLAVRELSEANLNGLDLVLFATGPAVSREFVPVAAAAGALAVDNSRAFRQDPAVPLVVPEVNPEAAFAHRGIIANPNCSTIQMVLVLRPIDDAATVRRVVVSTYQSVSGTGLAAVEELREQSRDVLDGRPAVSRVYASQIAFNCLPSIDDFDEEGASREETKMILETRKIMGAPDLPVAATCVRVPVFRAHAMSIAIETEVDLPPSRARALLTEFPGVRVLDDPGAGKYPTQLDAAGNDDVWVGRVRRDPSVEHGLWLWAVSDNLRKGAATNAVQIAELLLEGAGD
jgi:aspartate-semialdehyde dehydrogenase